MRVGLVMRLLASSWELLYLREPVQERLGKTLSKLDHCQVRCKHAVGQRRVNRQHEVSTALCTDHLAEAIQERKVAASTEDCKEVQ